MQINIKKIIREVIRETLLSEFITNDEIYLRDYLSMSEEAKKEYLPHEYHYFFDDFIEETGEEFNMPREMVPSNYEDEPEEEVDMFDSTIELMTYLENNDRNLYDKFANYLYKKITNNDLPIPDSEYPAWSYFDDNPQVIKNQWLIHFTDDANGISEDGFKYGADDMTKLGLTTQLGEFDKKYGGYNFAYLLSDFPKYSRRGYTQGGGYKYGKEAVVFNASGIKVWHHGDEEPQVIFYGNTATNIIPITSGENFEWAIRSKDDRVLFENDSLERVVDWISNNYQQYRKSLSEDVEVKDVSDDDETWDRVKIIAKNKGGKTVGYAVLDMTMLPEYEFNTSDEDSNEYSDEEVEKHFPDEYSVAKLEHLEVYFEFRKMGYGKELMDAAVKYVKSRGYKTMYLLASPIGVNKIDLDVLTDFYKNYGFEIIKDYGNSRGMVSQIDEAALRTADLPETVALFSRDINQGHDLVLYDPKAKNVYGTITIAQRGYYGPNYFVTGVAAERGFGPFIYELAMMHLSREGRGLMPTRDGDVRDVAFSVWKQFFNRPDIKKETMTIDNPYYRFDILGFSKDDFDSDEEIEEMLSELEDYQIEALKVFNTSYSMDTDTQYNHLLNKSEEYFNSGFDSQIAIDKAEEFWNNAYM